jgi:hypothetical protein
MTKGLTSFYEKNQKISSSKNQAANGLALAQPKGTSVTYYVRTKVNLLIPPLLGYVMPTHHTHQQRRG